MSAAILLHGMCGKSQREWKCRAILPTRTQSSSGGLYGQCNRNSGAVKEGDRREPDVHRPRDLGSRRSRIIFSGPEREDGGALRLVDCDHSPGAHGFNVAGSRLHDARQSRGIEPFVIPTPNVAEESATPRWV